MSGKSPVHSIPSLYKPVISRELRQEMGGRKFKRMDETRWSTFKLALLFLVNLYVSLRIYFTTSGLRLTSLTNPSGRDLRRFMFPVSPTISESMICHCIKSKKVEQTSLRRHYCGMLNVETWVTEYKPQLQNLRWRADLFWHLYGLGRALIRGR